MKIGAMLLGTMLIAGPVYAGATPQQKDFCLTFPAPITYELIGKHYTIPKPGQCAEWIGFAPVDGDISVTNGVGCTLLDGRWKLTATTAQGLIVLIDQVTLDTTTLQGVDDENGIIQGALQPGGASSSVTGAPCSPSQTPAALAAPRGANSGPGLF